MYAKLGNHTFIPKKYVSLVPKYHSLLSSSFFLCSLSGTTVTLIGLDFVNSFVVLNAGDYVFATLAAGNGALRSGSPPRLELDLIMELN